MLSTLTINQKFTGIEKRSWQLQMLAKHVAFFNYINKIYFERVSAIMVPKSTEGLIQEDFQSAGTKKRYFLTSKCTSVVGLPRKTSHMASRKIAYDTSMSFHEKLMKYLSSRCTKSFKIQK